MTTATKKPSVHMTACDSAAITAHGYDAATRTLALQFKSGHAPHFYAEVPQEVYDGLLKAESKGRYIGSQIRGQYASPKADD